MGFVAKNPWETIQAEESHNASGYYENLPLNLVKPALYYHSF